MSHTDELRAELASAKGRLRALQVYAANHPGVTPPLLNDTEALVRDLTARMAAHHRQDNNMMKYGDPDALRGCLNKVQDELRTLHSAAGDRRLNPQQQARWDELSAEADEISRDLEEAEAAEARAKAVAASRARWNTLQVGAQVPNRSNQLGEVRSNALRVLDDQRSAGHLSPAQLDHLDGLIRSTDRNTDGAWIAQAIVMTENDAYRSAFRHILADSTPVLTAEEANALRAYQEFRAASLTDSAGGYGVSALVDPTIVKTSQGSLNPVRRVARNVTITGESWRGVSSDGVTWSWDGEAEEVSDDAPTLAGPEIKVHKAQGFVPFSIEIASDYGRGGADFAAEMSRLLAEGYDELLAGALVNGAGDGSNQPVGVLTALAANTNTIITPVTSGLFSHEDVHKLWAAIPDRARDGAYWLGNPSTFSYLSAFGDTYGSRTTSLDGTPRELRGRPILETSQMPAFSGTTGGANILIVGDFQKYLIANRAGMSVEVVPHLFGTTNGRPTGQRGLYAWARVGADVIDDLAFRLLANAGE